MSTYNVTATREGKWWLVAIPEIDGLTQARRYTEIATMASEYIAVNLDVSMDSFTVNVSVESVDDVRDIETQVTEILTARRTAEQLDQDATIKAAKLAHSLRDKNIPIRDIGAIMHLSYQRVAQILSAHRAA